MVTAPSPMPWLDAVVERAMRFTRSHAVLLHGAAGDGLFDAGHRIAQGWLCAAPAAARRPCGQCASCHQFVAGTHPDLHRLLPEDLRVQLGAPAAEADEPADGESRSRRKPSRQIRIDELRAAVDWLSTTSSRGGIKVVLVHPAEAMNPQSASALLKTLEEPPAATRLLLCAAQPQALLPTIRSRCQVLRLDPVEPALARSWLEQQGLTDTGVLLAAASNRPLDALALAASGIDGARWAALPAAAVAGQAAAFAGFGPQRLLDTMQKLCHDALAVAAGAAPRFFPPASVAPVPSIDAPAAWSRELSRIARHVEHPWNEALLVDALLQGARSVWSGSRAASDTLAR